MVEPRRDSEGLSHEPHPLMTFSVAGTWVGVSIEHMQCVTLAEEIWPVPGAPPHHLGLFEHQAQLLPVLTMHDRPPPPPICNQLLAVLQVRGDSVALAIDSAGQVVDHHWPVRAPATPPAHLAGGNPRRARSSQWLAKEDVFWLIDTDELWPSQATL